MGCGLSATLRSGAALYRDKVFSGVTIVPWQIKKGKELNDKANLSDNINLFEGDYTNMIFSDNSFDAVYAIESACHSKGDSKEELIKEMSRVLKPGKRFVVADGFVKNPEKAFSPFVKKSYDAICENWALTSMAEISAFKKGLKDNGFKDILIEDISWKVAPSAVQTPYVVVKFLIKKIFKNEKLKPQSFKNLKGCILALVLGLCRSKFGYYIISGVKK